jgi:hypothetical protein
MAGYLPGTVALNLIFALLYDIQETDSRGYGKPIQS